MAELTNQSLEPSTEGFPEVPTIFADGILNLANSQQVAKFYFFRFDPSALDAYRAQARPSAQVIMPIDGLLSAFAFLESAIERLKNQGIISENQLSVARQLQATR